VSWTIDVTNNGIATTADFWITATKTGVKSTDFILADDVYIPAGYHGSTEVTMAVPQGAPTGTYTIDNKLGDYPGSVYASDGFTITIANQAKVE
jgi:hypothetical protein